MAVKYYTDDCSYRLPRKRLTAEWLRRVAEAEGYELGDVSYIFCSAQRLLEMNRQYLGHDYFTDVITFDYSDRKGARVISGEDRKSTRLNSSHNNQSRMPSSA